MTFDTCDSPKAGLSGRKSCSAKLETGSLAQPGRVQGSGSYEVPRTGRWLNNVQRVRVFGTSPRSASCVEAPPEFFWKIPLSPV
jgi:hypothetical protein